jgi:hypothetical protein
MKKTLSEHEITKAAKFCSEPNCKYYLKRNNGELMNLADKPCYPLDDLDRVKDPNDIDYYTGLTLRERLIISLAGNPNMTFPRRNSDGGYEESNAKAIVAQADAIIKEMENL